MGMSASQARLLTITGRLTDNELRSQTITNAKLRLAQKSSEASQTYMDALSSEKLVFKTYDSNGASSSNNLTPALLYSYEPLKNQYSIQNASGQNLVSATDAKNYEETNTLSQFLDRYGLSKDTTDADKYQADMTQYYKDLETYNKAKADYDEKMKIYEEQMKQWEASKNQQDLYAIFSGAVGTSDIEATDPIVDKGGYCYYHALNTGDAGCYLHLLNEILDFDGVDLQERTYTTTVGDEVTTDAAKGAMWGYCNNEMKQTSDAMNEKDADGNYIRVCDGKDVYPSDEKINLLEEAKNEGREPSKLERLKSDYIENADGTYSLKSLKQKAIDLYYLIQSKMIKSSEEMKETLINFTDGDMRNLTIKEEPEKPTLDATRPELPKEPTYGFAVLDKDKAQWYINLWYMMNGSESANKLKDSVNVNGETIYTTDDNLKSKNPKNYKVIDDQLFTSSDWLTFALKNGVVTLNQASYFNPATDSGKVSEMTAEGYYWNATAYSSTTDIVSVEDEVAIAKAEVKYKNTTTEIENQDKKYDQDLKKLDTEHNALQTEYESLKSVIDKNVERSFKAFS